MSIAIGIGASIGINDGASPVVTSYTNPLSTGNRTATITVSANPAMSGGPASALVNGTKSGDTGCYISARSILTSEYIRFDLGTAKVIQEAKWYQSAANANGVWIWQGSNDATNWTDIGDSFTLGGATTQTQTTLSANTSSYRYYQMRGVSGSSSSTPYTEEIEFKIN
jgi:hypothetical protein